MNQNDHHNNHHDLTGEHAGITALQRGAFKDAVTILTEALSHADGAAPERHATLERQLGQAYLGLGDAVESQAHLISALTLLGYTIPARSMLVRLIQNLSFLLPGRKSQAQSAKPSSAETALEAARIYGALAEILYFRQGEMAGVSCILRMIELTEHLAPSPELAEANTLMALACNLLPMRRRADTYASRAEEVARGLGEMTLVHNLNRLAAYYVGIGRHVKAEALLLGTLEIADLSPELRDSLPERIANYTTLAVLCHYQGRFEDALKLSEAMQGAARSANNLRQQIEGLYMAAVALNRLGRSSEALARLEEALTLLEEQPAPKPDTSLLMRLRAAKALAFLRLGSGTEAQTEVGEAVNLLGRARPTLYSGLDFYATIADVYLTALENGEVDASNYIPVCEYSCEVIQRFATIFPVGRPRSLVWQARLDWLSERPDRAVKTATRALELAQSLGLPYDEALARYELGKHGTDAASNLARAADLFHQLKAQYDLDLVGKAQGVMQA